MNVNKKMTNKRNTRDKVKSPVIRLNSNKFSTLNFFSLGIIQEIWLEEVFTENFFSKTLDLKSLSDDRFNFIKIS